MATKLAAGDRVNDRYELVRPLGSGAGGAVYLALDHARDKSERALKLMEGEAAPDLTAEFARLAALAHPRLLRVHELDRVRSGPLPAGALFFTADHLPGPPARDLVSARAAAERSALLCALAADLAAALAELHAAGLTHHDVTPDNVLIDGDGHAVLADLGLAGLRGAGTSARGTPAYMAPEALVGSSDPAVDLFGLGATLYALAAGQAPYPGEGALVLRAALAGRARPLPELAPWLDAELAALIAALMAPRPDLRPSSARAVLAALTRVREGLGEVAAETPAPSGAMVLPPAEVALVGRRRELAALADALAGGPVVVLLAGAPGSGRSRVARAALQAAQLAMASGAAPPAQLVGDRLAAAEPLLGRAIAAGDEPPGSDGARRRQALAAELAAGLLAAAARAPLLLHLADPGGLAREVLASLVRGGEPGAHRFAVLAEVSPQEAAELAAADPAGITRTITLPPLDDAEVARLAAALCGEPLDARAERALVEAAAGSPALAVELARLHGAGEPLQGGGLPALLARRLEALPAPQRELAAALAVLGEPASAAALSEIFGDPEATIAARLAELARAGLVRWQGALAGLRSAAHAAAAEAALPAGALARLHKAALAVLETRPPDARTLRARARHLREVGPRAAAAEAALAAAGEARRALDLPGALAHLEDAVRQSTGAAAAEPALAAGELATALGDYARAAALLERAGKAARAGSDAAPGGEAGSFAERTALASARLALRRGDYDAAERAALALLPSPDAGRDSAVSLEARALAARARIARGRYADAAALSEGPLTPHAGDSAARIRARATLAETAGLSRFYLGDLAAAERPFEAVAAAARLLGDDALLGRARSLAGMVAQQRGAIDVAAGCYEEALALARRASDLHGAAVYAANLGAALKERADYAHALERCADAVRDLGRLGRTAELAGALFNRGVLLIALGDSAGAARAAARARAEADAVRAPLMAGYARLLEGDLARRRGDLAGAAHGYQEGERLFGEAGAAREAGLAALNGVDALVDAGRVAEARAALARLAARAAADPDLSTRVTLAAARVALADPAGTPAQAGAAAPPAELITRLAGSGRRDLAFRAELLAAALHLRAGDPVRAGRELAHARATWDAIVAGTPEAYRAGLGQDPDARLLARLESGPQSPARMPAGDAAQLAAEARLRRVLAVNRRLNSELSPERILEELIDTAIEILGAERGFLLIAEGGALAIKVARNIAREDLGPGNDELALSRSIAERAAMGGAPIVAVDAELDERWRGARSVAALHLRSVLAVPLSVRGRLVGALYVDHRLRKGAFRDDDVQLVLDIADQAALALAHAEHAREIDRQRRELADLNRRLEAEVERQTVELTSMRIELSASRDDFSARYDYSSLIGASPALRELKRVLDRATATHISVLIHGESGTGKELVARALHANGPRRGGPFVAANCGAITETLLESELFGAVRGAYTGADRERRGLFEVADGGTLLLDEIGEMSPALQAKLLRVLQDGEVRRVGAERSRKVDVRIVAASNKDLARLVEDGRFREDLYYRVNVVRIDVPPLRERIEDVPLLCEHFLKKHAPEGGRPRRLTREALRKLMSYRWPGNVRELENELVRASVMASAEVIGAADLSPRLTGSGEAPEPDGDLAVRPRVERLERTLLREALRRAHNNQTQAARLLGLSRFGLQKKLRRYRLES